MKGNHKAGWNKILSNKFDLKNLIDYVMCIKIINAQNTALLKNLGISHYLRLCELSKRDDPCFERFIFMSKLC
jgi:hypothetical protein